MKNKILIFTIILFLANVIGFGQNQTIPPPSKETFTPSFGRIDDKSKLGERAETDTVKIFNADGSIWYEFSYYKNSPLYHGKNLKPELNPMGRLKVRNLPGFDLMLTLKAESENWYEIIVDEETQSVKYISKSEKTLGKEDWESYMPRWFLTFDKKQNPLRDAPDGKVSAVQMPEKQKFFMIGYSSEIKGDWVFI